MKSEDGKVQYNPSKEEVEIDQGDVEVFDDGCSAQLRRMPKNIWSILTVELCERFSYYGIKTVLVLYLVQSLKMDKATGKAVYHAFSMCSYFLGVLGAIVADSWTGKFKLILWTLVVYSLAEIALTLTSLPFIGQNSQIGPLVGLFVMAAATGNIKPCVAAFGGEQLNQKDTGIITKYFGLFYMSVNVGALVTMLFMPMMRTDIECYGGDCYPAVFGANTVLIIVATVVFGAGSKSYKKVQPDGNIMLRVCSMIWYAATSKTSKSAPNHQHWLHKASDRFSKEEIEDVRSLLKVLIMYIPLPVFWALFHQQGSSWTLQAEQMNGDIGGFNLRSDQIQFINPVLVLMMIPLFDAVIYPTLAKMNLELSPLKKMTGGMLLASVAFLITGFIQIKIQTLGLPPVQPAAGTSSVDFLNGSPCQQLIIDPDSFFKIKLGYGERTSHLQGQSGNRTFNVRGINCFGMGKNITQKDVTINLKPDSYQNVVIDVEDETSFSLKMLDQMYPEASVETANTRVRVLYIPAPSNPVKGGNLTFVHAKNDRLNIERRLNAYDSKYSFFLAEEYTLKFVGDDGKEHKIELPTKLAKFGTFGAYTLLLSRGMGKKNQTKLSATILEDIPPVIVHRLWQLPQYIVITAGEIMFSVTGLEFAYSQAPPSMKSVLQSMWLVTTAFGDLLVMILSLVKPVDSVEEEMFLYAGVMLGVAIIFALMSKFAYTYSDFSGNIVAVQPADEEGEMKTADSTTHL